MGPMGEGQTPEGPSWWSHLGDSQDDQQTRPQEGGTGDAWGTNRRSNQLPRYQTPFTMSTPYMTGGYRYQGTGKGPSGGPPGGGGRPPGRGCGSGGGDGYDPGDGDEEEDEDDATSSSSENPREVSPRRLDQWIRRMTGTPGGGGPLDEPDLDYDDPYDWLRGPRGHRGHRR